MNTQDVTKTAAEVAPPVTYAALRFFGMPLPDLVGLATLAYIMLQAAYLIWRWRRAARRHGDG